MRKLLIISVLLFIASSCKKATSTSEEYQHYKTGHVKTR